MSAWHLYEKVCIYENLVTTYPQEYVLLLILAKIFSLKKGCPAPLQEAKHYLMVWAGPLANPLQYPQEVCLISPKNMSVSPWLPQVIQSFYSLIRHPLSVFIQVFPEVTPRYVPLRILLLITPLETWQTEWQRRHYHFPQRTVIQNVPKVCSMWKWTLYCYGSCWLLVPSA